MMTTPGSYFRHVRAAALLCVAVFAAACGGGDGGTGPAPDNSPASVTATTTAPTNAVVGATISGMTVLVKASNNLPVSGVTVTFATTGGGSVGSTTATTNAAGQATSGPWTLGNTVGSNTLTATVGALPTVQHQVTTTADIAASLSAAAGNAATATVGQTLTPSVRLADKFGNAVAGVPVTFVASNGTVTGATVTTDASGNAKIGGWTLSNAAGVQKLSATAGSFSVDINVNVAAGAAAVIQKVSGDAQTGTAGAAVATRPSVRVTDTHGNVIANATVTFNASAGGAVAGSVQVTGADGIATIGAWTLANTAGANALVASMAGVPSATFTATGTAGAAAKIAKDAGDNQTAPAGSALPIAPTVIVRDQFDNVVAGAQVTFAVSTGGGTVTGGATKTTDASGKASAGWTLGTTGTNLLRASITAGEVAFSATATGDINAPASVTATTNSAANAVAGSTTTGLTVVVKNAGGTVLSGIPVTFAVTGGGTITTTSATTNASGEASSGSWTLGNTVGANVITATVQGLTAVSQTITTTPGAAVALVKVAGDNQSAVAGTALTTKPSVRVADIFGNAVSNTTVTFAGSAGSVVSGASQVSSATGIATVGGWTLASVAGANTLSASLAGGLGEVTFTATGTSDPLTGFDIEVRFLTSVTATQQAAFTAAAARWKLVITGDIPGVTVPTNLTSFCADGVGAEVVDDLLIYATVGTIDGAGGVLGQAGPCITRNGSDLPAIGIMEFDVADLANLEANGTLQNVILHEMGHVLGIGTNWQTRNLIGNPCSTATAFVACLAGSDPFFSGAGAKSSFTLVGGTLVNGVPIENCQGLSQACGEGTQEGHWRETTFRNELMTGYISQGASPLSSVTVLSLQDLGYTVNPTSGDAFNLLNLGIVASGSAPANGMWLKEGRRPAPIRLPR